ncbi:glycosyltransferase family 4 protein [uncultured Psychrobacter sp.]|jgi:glycosyltransferase involved in cell wall biosynthesis|uniref:glycosyltransferase family 4 protein n=1 Tax=uncultured Psychrobacter sp. TaxID=259303 RepID=UPI0026283CEF|nr:glycosyltransferase family 4 protein [uncultured Psychrobacter sp.]
MNILHVISTPASGGAEVYVKDLAKYLSAQGHVMHIAFLSNAADAGRDAEYEKDFLADLHASGVHTYIIGNETRKKPWLGMLRVRKYIKDNAIDICHTHLAYGIVFSTLSKIPVIYTHHTIEQRWNTKVYSIFNQLVDEYVGISKICASALSKYTGKKVTTITNAVAEDKFSGYVRQRDLNDVVIFAMVGRIDVQKDYLNMLRALNLLDTSVQKRLKVLIAGEGDDKYKSELLAYISKNKLDNVVKFVGVKKNIPEFLYQADIFLMSSSFEGLPIALIEAAVLGMPCIVTDVGGCTEIITTSKNGVAVSPNKPEEVADEIVRFISDKTLIKQFSINAIDNAHKYSISKAADLHIGLYELILK